MDQSLLVGWPVVIEHRVAWNEMDAYGHVNNAIVVRYLENARLEYFRRLGQMVTTRPTGHGIILASVQCRFRKQLSYPDTLALTARITDMQADRFTMEHQVISECLGVVAAEGSGVIVTIDYATEKKIPIWDDLRQRIAALEATARRPDM